MKALINANLYDFDQYRPNSYMLFQDSIVEVGGMSDFPGAESITDCQNALVLPGLVNCHSHLYATFARGLSIFYEPASFQQILDQLWWRLDRHLDHDILRNSALVSGLEQLKSGVTTIIDHNASGRQIDGSLSVIRKALCDEIGMRAVLCFETSDRYPIEACIRENQLFAASPVPGISAGMFGMHASLSLSDASLEQIASVRNGLPIHIHVGESIEDVQNSWKLHRKSPVARLNDYGLLSENAILAHCVHVDDNDLMLIKASGACIAVNPTSNMNNAVGLPSIQRFLKMGIPVVIGNDSLGTHLVRDLQNTLYTAHLSSGSPWEFGYQNLQAIIREGYRLTGRLLGKPMGSFTAGYAADMIRIPYRPPTPMNSDNMIGHIIDGVFSQFNPRDVWVRGKQLIRNFESIYSEDKIYKNAQVAAELLWQRIKEEN